MSTEQDKDSFSLKRNRGAEAGLDVLGGPGLLVGSPEKKRRKSSTQAASFSPLSEYAPPANPSSDHLIAANPFDDDYSSPSLKPVPPANPYFGHSLYPGFSGYGPPRMAPQMPHRMPSPYPFQMRNQPVVFNGTPGFNYENPHYMHPLGGGINSRMHFRSEHLSQMPLHNPIQHPDAALGFSPARDMSPNQNSFTTPKQDPSEAANKTASPRKPNNCEEPQETKASREKLNGVLRSDSEPVKKPLNRRSTSSSSEPVFPCGACRSEVHDDQEAILCEASCQKWFHRVCTGMTETAYNLLTAEASAVWGCDACMEDSGAQRIRTPARTPSAPGDAPA